MYFAHTSWYYLGICGSQGRNDKVRKWSALWCNNVQEKAYVVSQGQYTYKKAIEKQGRQLGTL
jgi:hypothetical protein